MKHSKRFFVLFGQTKQKRTATRVLRLINNEDASLEYDTSKPETALLTDGRELAYLAAVIVA